MLDALLKEFERKRVLAYARARVTAQFLGELLFPIKPINELTYEYWKSQNLLTVMASIQAFGAEAQIASRDGAEKVSGELPPIKRKIPLGERNLLALKRAGAGDVDMVKNQLYNDLDNMIASVHARIEKMRIDAIALGGFNINENGVVMNVNFGVPQTQQANLQPLNQFDGDWDQPLAQPVTMLIAWTNAVADATGIRPTRAVTSNTVLANMLNNAQIRTLIYGDLGGSRAVTLNKLNELLESMNLPIIVTYDDRARAQNANGTYTTTRYYNSKRITLLPPGPLGETLMGPTAEALMDKALEAKESAGIYARVDAIPEPPAIWTKAAALAFPTFPMADAVFIAEVLP